MRIAAGFKAHSGWAALVVIGVSGEDLQVVDRRRIELVDPGDIDWAKQPYHAAEDLPPAKARNADAPSPPAPPSQTGAETAPGAASICAEDGSQG